MNKFLVFCIHITLCLRLPAQTFFSSQPLAHTYSIVARDPETGEMGVAVQSHWFSVGSLVIWGEAGVGVVATQSFVNPAYGPQGLALMKLGLSPDQVMSVLTSQDEGRDYRQVAFLDREGRVATHTGRSCIPDAGHLNGPNYSVQANLMSNPTIWSAMEKAFLASKGPLAERLLAALEAAQAAGGDIRGKQSAAILVVKGNSTGKPWEDRPVDLRVEDHEEPIKEIQRLLRVHRAYEHMNKGDLAVEKGNIDLALQEYGAAEAMFPENLEMQYWHGVSLININKIEEGVKILKSIFAKDQNWKVLTPRLVPIGLLKADDKVLELLMK